MATSPIRTSKISIVDLEVNFNVGVSDEERAQPQRLLISVEMGFDFSSAAASDRVAKTIDYYEVSRAILKLGEGRSWKLIEKLAAEIADLVLTQFRPQSVMVEVKKFAVTQARHVSVSLVKQATQGTIKGAAWGIP
jgi:7,8-dihydroneopterin aldolase/epimerase/oxygenase